MSEIYFILSICGDFFLNWKGLSILYRIIRMIKGKVCLLDEIRDDLN